MAQMQRREKMVEKQISKDKEYVARFVAHITIPDLSCMQKGQRFTKTWRFRNEGTQTWPADTCLVFISKAMGDVMGTQPLSFDVFNLFLPFSPFYPSLSFFSSPSPRCPGMRRHPQGSPPT